MRRAAPHVGRLVPIRLTDVPLDVRLRAVRAVTRGDDDARPEDRLFAVLRGGDDLRAAAESPSTTTYWLPREAVDAARARW